MILVVLTAAVLLVGTALLVVSGPAATNPGTGLTAARTTPGPTTTTQARDEAFGAALYFLGRYEQPGGRVVRWDQGGDTVSEGEAYAMLLSAAAGDRDRFDAAWNWTRSHLLQPSGLLAWHWARGRATSTEPAADADVDAAYALELAASRFAEPADRVAAAAMASAVVRDESVAGPSGLILVAGPWAVGPPAYANPSYASPAELSALGGLTTDGQDFAALAAGTRDLVGRVLATDALPPDWVQEDAGRLVAVAPPGQEPNDGYGFDAVRLPIRWAASCDATDRRVAAAVAAVGSGGAGGTDHRGPEAVRTRWPASAACSGRSGGGRRRGLGRRSSRCCSRVAGQSRGGQPGAPDVLLDAWVGLGRMLLETRRLGSCGAA